MDLWARRWFAPADWGTIWVVGWGVWGGSVCGRAERAGASAEAVRHWVVAKAVPRAIGVPRAALRAEELRTAARAVRIIRTAAAVATEAIRHRTSVKPAARRAIRIVRTAGVTIRVARRTSSAARPFFSGPSASAAPALVESILKVLELSLPPLSLVVGQGGGDLLVHLLDLRVYFGFSLFLDFVERVKSRLENLVDFPLLFRGKNQHALETPCHHKSGECRVRAGKRLGTGYEDDGTSGANGDAGGQDDKTEQGHSPAVDLLQMVGRRTMGCFGQAHCITQETACDSSYNGYTQA